MCVDAVYRIECRVMVSVIPNNRTSIDITADLVEWYAYQLVSPSSFGSHFLYVSNENGGLPLR